MQNKRTRTLILIALGVMIAAQILFLSPTSVEQPEKSKAIDPKDLLQELDESHTLAPGIPKGKIPEYSIDGFDYVCSKGEKRQWKLMARKAYMYNEHRLVHARLVVAHLYDDNGEITEVTGLEAKYFMNQRDLEIFGEVQTRFPDGFVVKSDYMRYHPDKKIVDIPKPYRVVGAGQQGKDQHLSFDAIGMLYLMGDARMHLHEKVTMTLRKTEPSPSPTPSTPTASSSPSTTEVWIVGPVAPAPSPSPSSGPAQFTTIESDKALIYRDRQYIDFDMFLHRPLRERFVRITQPNLYARSRRARMFYGDIDSNEELLHSVIAYDDALVKEKCATGLRYGTGGIAEFDSKNSLITLKDYPQVYQDQDTVTGDLIIVHRDTDIVEVEQSNAFSQGKPQASPSVRPFEDNLPEPSLSPSPQPR